MIKNLLGGLFGKVVENAEGILDEIITTDEERDKAKLEIKRILYKDDAFIQKILAALFTIAYFLLTYTMFKYFVLHEVVLSEYEIGFISTVFGAMSAKVNTIVDFFFGGSSKENK